MPPPAPDAPVAPLSWKRTWVDDRPARYLVAGSGLPVLFLHGWGLAHHSYRASIERLVLLGCRVHAPSLPGFGGTPDLPRSSFSLSGYARWVASFAEAVGLDEPLFTVGHSFGGGVAVKLAHGHPELVRSLVLVNSVGGTTWRDGDGRAMADRPLWDWGRHLPSDVWPLPQAGRLLPAVLPDLVGNVARNPRGLWRVGQLARRVDLTRELADLKAREVPVVAIWGARDGVIPRASFDALCRALGSDGQVVEGSHSWLLADPDAFGEVITNHVEVAKLAWKLEHEPRRRRGLLGLPPLRNLGSWRRSAAAADVAEPA